MSGLWKKVDQQDDRFITKAIYVRLSKHARHSAAIVSLFKVPYSSTQSQNAKSLQPLSTWRILCGSSFELSLESH